MNGNCVWDMVLDECGAMDNSCNANIIINAAFLLGCVVGDGRCGFVEEEGNYE